MSQDEQNTGDIDGAVQSGARRHNWKQDPEKVQRDIVAAATLAFADHGYSQTRIDDIAAQTATSKRMIYYYFGDKKGLYAKVLEAAYLRMDAGEATPKLDDMSPMDALRSVIRFQFMHNLEHPEFVRLLMVENIHNAETLKASELLKELRPKARAVLDRIYDRGVSDGVFQKGIDPLILRVLISGVSFFNISNRPSFSALFGDDLWSDERQSDLLRLLTEAVLRLVMTPEALARHVAD